MKLELKYKIPLKRVDFHTDFAIHGATGVTRSIHKDKTPGVNAFMTDKGIMLEHKGQWWGIDSGVQSYAFLEGTEIVVASK